MLRVSFARIRPEMEPKLRDWLAQLMVRRAEVLETFAGEGTSQEQAYILPTSDGPMLVYVMDTQDNERARAAYALSSHAIDLEHRAILTECLGERLRLTPLYACSTEKLP